MANLNRSRTRRAIRKQTSAHISSLAARVLADDTFWPDRQQLRSMAASLLSQDQTKGQGDEPAEPTDVKEIPDV